MDPEPPDQYAALPRAPVAAEAVCPATGARANGRVQELSASGVHLQFAENIDGFDVGAAIDITFVSGVLGGSKTVRGRVTRARSLALEAAFEPGVATPLGSLFNRRNSLRIRPDALPLDHRVVLIHEDGPELDGHLEDLSMRGAAIVVPDPSVEPKAGDRVRVRLTNPTSGLTVWMSGAVRHVSSSNRHHRLGIAFDMRMADIEGAGPALHALVREIEQAQLDTLVLAHAGLAPKDAR